MGREAHFVIPSSCVGDGNYGSQLLACLSLRWAVDLKNSRCRAKVKRQAEVKVDTETQLKGVKQSWSTTLQMGKFYALSHPSLRDAERVRLRAQQMVQASVITVCISTQSLRL